MSLAIMILIFFGGLSLLLLFGTEIVVAFGIMGSLGLLLFVPREGQNTLIWTSWHYLNNFTLTAVPLYIFMGEIFANTGVIRHLFDAANKWVGGLRGGLASSTIVASALFGAMSGSSVAAAAIFGKVTFPEMQRQGYKPSLALGSIAIGGTLSVLIPPSIILIIYGSWQNESVVRLFAGAVVPGIILTILLLLTVILMVSINPSLAPRSPKYPWHEKLSALVRLLPWFGIIGVVLGVIFTGVMTPTESAAMGAFLSLITALAYRELTFKALKESFLSTVKVTSMTMIIVCMANVFAHVVQMLGIADSIARHIIGSQLGTFSILAGVFVLYLILGLFFDSISMMVLTLPFVAPVISGMGYSLLWFGVLFVILAEIGLVTPPFGLNLFVLQGVTKYDLMTVAWSAAPFIVPTLIAAIIITIWPELVLWLPRVLYSS